MLIRFPELKTRFGISYSRVHLARLIKAGRFPAPVRVGDNRRAWLEHEVVEHLNRLAAQRDPRPAA